MNTPILPRKFDQTIPSGGASTIVSQDFEPNPDGLMSFTVFAVTCNITDCIIEVKHHEKDPYQQYLEGSDFSSSVIPQVLRSSSPSPNAVAAGQSAWSEIKFSRCFSFRFKFVVSGAGLVLVQGLR